MKVILTSLLIFLINANLVFGVGHQPLLHPTTGILETLDWHLEYLLKVREILHKDLCKFPAFRMTTLPSFQSEWAVEFEIPKQGDALVRYVTVKDRMIWQNDNLGSLKKITETAHLPRDLAKSVSELIQAHTLAVNYSAKSSSLLDGVKYYFTCIQMGKGFQSGMTHSPKEEWPTGNLVAVGKLLRDLTLTNGKGTDELIAQLRHNVQVATERLNKETVD